MSQITITKILDGARNAVFHIFLMGDGSGDLSSEIIIDPAADFDPPLPAKPELRITKLWYDFVGFTGYLTYDYLTSNTPIWSMSSGQCNQPDFGFFGGITDRSNALDGLGKIKLTTSGLDDGDFGALIIGANKS
jgi:hypothetical protein